MKRACHVVLTLSLAGAACAATASKRLAVAPGSTATSPVTVDPLMSPEEFHRSLLAAVDGGTDEERNVKAWRLARFFERVKGQTQQQWHPDLAVSRLGVDAAIHGHQQRLTVILVRLAPNGDLFQALVHKSSGVKALDDEAVQAFKKAAPFGDPPTFDLDFDGLFSFRFGFLFQHPGVDGGVPLVDGSATADGS